MNAKFTGIADIANSEFQGKYSPIDTVQQINATNGQKVKEVIEQSIAPINVIPTLQTQELTGPNDGPHCPTQIFQRQQRNIHNPNMYTPLDHSPHRTIGYHQLLNHQNDTVQNEMYFPSINTSIPIPTT